MAEPIFKFDESKVKAHLEAVKKAHLAVGGKPGYNPFVFLTHTLNPLEASLLKGDRTEALQKAILALPLTPAKL